jgi:predicted Zn-dependent peptidase
MTRLNRSQTPEIKDITKIDFILPEKWELTNGVPVWGLKAGSQELVKIDFIFDAGSWYQTENLVAGLANAFMSQGSKNFSAQEIAETFDFRGAYLQLTADQQFGNISVLTLTKYLDDILRVTSDVIKNPSFPKKEIKVQIAKRKQQFIIENNKVKTLAHKRFTQVIFGENHPYANTNIGADFDSLTRDKLIAFHAKNYRLDHCRIVIAGNYDDSIKVLLDRYFGDTIEASVNIEPKHTPQPNEKKKHFVEKPDAVQSAIRIGKRVINREHPDFHGLTVLTTILGGYFGSRLMTNVREDKGYTYGINASIVTFPHEAYFNVMTEVGTEVCAEATTEIFAEIKRLIDEPVTINELEIVRNYLLGDMLRNFDGVFALSNSLKTLIESGLDYSHYQRYIEELRSIAPDKIQQLAATHLAIDDIYEVVSGKRIR